MPDPTSMLDLAVDDQLWERVFLVAPLVVVGTREPDGRPDLAPKHLAMPMSWEPWFGFVCAPTHATLRNLRRTGEFAVSWPRADQLVAASLAASPRSGDDDKPVVAALATVEGRRVDAPLLSGALLQVECRLHHVVDGLGANSLVIGRVVAAAAHPDLLQVSDEDPNERLGRAQLPVYLHPARFTTVDHCLAFPFPVGFRR